MIFSLGKRIVEYYIRVYKHLETCKLKSYLMRGCVYNNSNSNSNRIIETDFFNYKKKEKSIHLLILNYNIPDYTFHIWKKSNFKICGDGGANKIYDLLPFIFPKRNKEELRQEYLPDIIRGDLDSIRNEVKSFYKNSNVRIDDLSYDQDTTDTEKCIMYLNNILDKNSFKNDKSVILVVGALGGRIDHTLSNLNLQYIYNELPLVMIGDGNMTRIINPGCTKIIIDKDVEGPKCAIIPLRKTATVTAAELKYPLNDHKLNIGGLISTSNSLTSDAIIIKTDEPVLWITRLNDLMIMNKMNNYINDKIID